ncbi:MAG: bifunctional phosphopantothenoylcysteine decarboxylase/phosphopantothenate--cysteine ligase CoaBC [Pseudomonadota bacterium]
MTGRRILLIIGGGIAAYKCLEFVRRAQERGFRVRAVMTRAATAFVTPLSMGAITGERVFLDLFDRDDEHDIGHIRLAREADAVVVAPATADLLAKMAGGHADDLASTVLLATDKPVLVAPAMNPQMWSHSATQRNVAQLRDDGIRFVGPNSGEMAESGESGVGRMAEPMEILEAVDGLLEGAVNDAEKSVSPLSGRRVLVTAGPTHEPIDPVRYIANRSSGKQGYAIADAASALGADVTLVSGPTTLRPPLGITTIQVESAADMLEAVSNALPVDVAIFAAAVADWRVDTASEQKIKKQSGDSPPTLSLVENPDILATIAKHEHARPGLVIGFAAETENVVAYAQAKRARKGCDWMIANDVSPATGIMGGDQNTIHVISADSVETWPQMAKNDVGKALMERVANHLAGR